MWSIWVVCSLDYRLGALLAVFSCRDVTLAACLDLFVLLNSIV